MALDWQAVAGLFLILTLSSAFVVLSYRYALPFFIKEVETTPWIVKVAFSLTTGISFLVFFLVWAEFGRWIPSIRSLAWQISISILLVLMILVLPAMLDFNYFSEGTGITNRYRYVFTVLAHLTQLYVFYRIGDFIPTGETTTHPFLTACVVRVGFLGISAMALVSGFGAVSALWNIFSVKRRVSELEVIRIKQSIEVSHEQMDAKARLLTKLEARQAEENGLFARLLGATSSQEVSFVQAELSDMQDLHNTLIADLTAAQAAFDDQARAKTALGLALKAFDVVFSVYCIYRIFSTTYNLSPWKDSQSSDPISKLLALLAAHYDENIDQESWARMIGFFLSGIVIAGSLRACLLVLAKVSKVLPRLINQQSMAMVFAILIGSYNIATAIVVCRNLPSAYGKNILSNLGASLEQSRFDVWFDLVFLIGVLITGLVLFLQQKLSGVDTTEEVTENEKRV